MDFYSARLLVICLVDDGRPRKTNMYDESVVVFRARDFDDALKRALEIGRACETEYENEKGQKVRWALVKIANLDRVGRKVDGKEVASHLHDRRSQEPIPFDQRFEPERNEPSQSF